MKIKKDMKVLIDSSNDLLKAYGKEKIPFLVDSVFTDDDGEDYVTLRFEDGELLKVVVMGFEVKPYAIA